MLYARQGAGKSTAAIQLAHALINGGDWLGFEVRKTGPVLYLQVDMGQHEMMKLVSRAEASGYEMHGQLHMFEDDAGEGRLDFDVLRDDSLEALRFACEAVRPVAVIVDTIHDSYEHRDAFKDVNALARRVHRRLKEAIGGAVLVFLNHQRKQGVVRKSGEELDDEDSFMGGQAWEGVVSSSLYLKRERGRRAKLKLRKIRLEDAPFEELALKINAEGFFEQAPPDYKWLLLHWPEHLPPRQRDEEVAKLTKKADVLRRIAELSGVPYDTVRQHENRHKGIEYPWRRYVGDGGDATAL